MKNENILGSPAFRPGSWVQLAALLLAILGLEGCVTMAAPPPMITLGGGGVAEAGHSQLGLGLGTGMSVFLGGHGGGSAWLGRWRQGLGGGWDLGIDAMGVQHADQGTIDLKLAGRYALADNLRFEAGFGGADDTNGKSLNADLGLTLGKENPEKAWNSYASVRIAGAKGYAGDLFGSGTSVPPDDFIIIAAVGADARISKNERFVGEFGIGPAFVAGNDNVGTLFYFGAGLLFDVGPNL